MITTNEDLDTLKENMDEATVSRLIEMADIFKMDGEDFRLHKGAKNEKK